MTIAVKDSKTKTKKEQPAAEIETGLDETEDLSQEREQIEKLKARVGRLQKTVQQRRDNFQLNLRQLRQNRDEKIVELRSKYDDCIDRGDAVGADKIMAELRKVRKELVNLAHNVSDLAADLSDLEKSQETLRIETMRLSSMCGRNLIAAKNLSDQAVSLMGTATNGIDRDLREISRTIEESKK